MLFGSHFRQNGVQIGGGGFPSVRIVFVAEEFNKFQRDFVFGKAAHRQFERIVNHHRSCDGVENPVIRFELFGQKLPGPVIVIHSVISW